MAEVEGERLAFLYAMGGLKREMTEIRVSL